MRVSLPYDLLRFSPHIAASVLSVHGWDPPPLTTFFPPRRRAGARFSGRGARAPQGRVGLRGKRIGTRSAAAPKGKLGISGFFEGKRIFFTKAAAGGPCAPANKGGAQGKVGHLGVFEKKKKLD